MKTLDMVDLLDKKSVQRYEDLLRHRFVRFGFRLSKGETGQPGLHHIRLKPTSVCTGFRITDIESDAIVAGQNYDLSIQDVEKFWIDEHNRRETQKRQKRRQKEAERLAAKKRPKTVKIDDRWVITNDARAIKTLNEHISQYGNFDADGHGAGGDIATVMYQAYRPYACPKFSRVWPVDGDWRNLTDCNLRSDADEVSFSDGVVPISPQRRIWHNENRIFLKLPLYENLFFTTYSPELFQLICNRRQLGSWYIQKQVRNSKTVHRLHCRVHGKITAFAEVIALYDAGKVDMDNIAGSILEGKQWLRENELQVDHLRDNVGNNCPHSIAIMPNGKNGGKNDIVTRISSPFAFIVVRVGEDFRIILGKFGTPDEYSRRILCKGAEQFLECLKIFYKIAKSDGEMLPRPKDHAETACISQMLWDDGLEYHEGQYNPIEWLLQADESDFTPWNGDKSLLRPDGG